MTTTSDAAVLLCGSQLVDPATGSPLVELGEDGVWRASDGGVVNALTRLDAASLAPAIADVRPRARTAPAQR